MVKVFISGFNFSAIKELERRLLSQALIRVDQYAVKPLDKNNYKQQNKDITKMIKRSHLCIFDLREDAKGTMSYLQLKRNTLIYLGQAKGMNKPIAILHNEGDLPRVTHSIPGNLKYTNDEEFFTCIHDIVTATTKMVSLLENWEVQATGWIPIVRTAANYQIGMILFDLKDKVFFRIYHDNEIYNAILKNPERFRKATPKEQQNLKHLIADMKDPVIFDEKDYDYK